MRLFFLFIILLLGQVAWAQRTTKFDLMPYPRTLTQGSGKLRIDANFTVSVKNGDTRTKAAVDRFRLRLQGRTGLDIVLKAPGETASLVFDARTASSRYPKTGEDESYALSLTAQSGSVTAPTSLGVLRGLETVLQLVASDDEGYFLPAVEISDSPRFTWRGLLIDAGRHFEPVDVIKRNLDAMAAVKLNVFHWHLTEDQGFRVESLKYPKLHELGSDGLYYTQAQIRDIVDYAADRGIRVVPEFDIPGHTTSWFVGHPELASGPGPYQIERKWGVFKPAMDPSNEAVYKVLEGFLGEMAALFPDEYLHIGGDEVEGHQWKENAKLQEWMKSQKLADNQALQAYFNRRVSAIITKLNRKMVGWDEILHPDLPNNIVVHSWRGAASLAEAAKKGYSGILSNGYYIDHVQPAERHYLVDPIPAGTDLTPEQQQRILGGEATMWGEYVTPETIDSRIWPRTAAIAERFWSPREVKDVADMYSRLQPISRQLEEHGLLHLKQQDAMFRRLANSEEINDLRTLSAYLEPIKQLDRYNWRKYTQQTPMTRFVDATRPDSVVGRRFNQLVLALLDEAPGFNRSAPSLASMNGTLSGVQTGLKKLLPKAPALKELDPMIKDVERIYDITSEALGMLSNHSNPPDGWYEKAMQQIDAIAKPKAEVEWAIIPGLRNLVTAVALREKASSMSPSEWKAMVIEQATPKKKR